MRILADADISPRTSVANSYSRRDREFAQAAAMLFPCEIVQGKGFGLSMNSPSRFAMQQSRVEKAGYCSGG